MEDVIVLIIFVAVYFLPCGIAGYRTHINSTAISILNLLLGWTVIGWIIALVWAFTNNEKNGIER